MLKITDPQKFCFLIQEKLEVTPKFLIYLSVKEFQTLSSMTLWSMMRHKSNFGMLYSVSTTTDLNKLI